MTELYRSYCGEFDVRLSLPLKLSPHVEISQNFGAVMAVSEDLLCSFELLKPLDGAALKKEMTKSKRKRFVVPEHPIQADSFRAVCRITSPRRTTQWPRASRRLSHRLSISYWTSFAIPRSAAQFTSRNNTESFNFLLVSRTISGVPIV